MNAQILSAAALVVIFLIGTLLPINMGALALAGAFLVGSVALGLSTKQIFAGFPGDLFVTLVGVTYLFAIAQKNGTVDWLVERSVRLVRGRVGAIPWVMFAIAAVLTGFGALGPAAVAILAPIALTFAAQYRINPVLMGLMVIHGAQAGGFSPISVYGGIVNGLIEKAHLAPNPGVVFGSSLFFNLGIAVVLFFVFGGLETLRRGKVTAAETNPHPDLASRPLSGHGGTPATASVTHPAGPAGPMRLDLHRSMTLLGLVVLGAGAVVFKFNVGLLAFVVAVALSLMAPKAQKGAIDKVSWSTVLLICGVVTYVEVMQASGAVDQIGAAISGLPSPLLAALLLCFTGAIISAFASSTALLGAIIPLAVPFLLKGELSAVGVISAIAVCTTIVDTSPFSTNGALVVAAAEDSERERVLRALIVYSAVIATAGPVVAWLVLVVPNWL